MFCIGFMMMAVIFLVIVVCIVLILLKGIFWKLEGIGLKFFCIFFLLVVIVVSVCLWKDFCMEMMVLFCLFEWVYFWVILMVFFIDFVLLLEKNIWFRFDCFISCFDSFICGLFMKKLEICINLVVCFCSFFMMCGW